ncbi:hypothetical protein [Nonlabens ponticola]|uniref:hypothetical protein n=1 Tax=Nonlabens ponticola TaxID=2496866 RepID=UPI001F4A014B|nr:hypothetical protein [Nonlabens ponticola]
MAIGKLIFVYNANSGRINSWLDSAHKIISPSTYQCKLCELTHGAFTEHDEWSRFRESLAGEREVYAGLDPARKLARIKHTVRIFAQG